MGTMKKIAYVAALGLLAAATTSFGEVGNPYINHGGYTLPQLPTSRPTRPGIPSYGAGYGSSGTIANGGGGFGGGFNQFNQGMLFDPYFSPYLNNAPWAMNNVGFGNQNMWSNPWTNWNTGYGNMMSPYFGSQFTASPFQNQMYGNQFNSPFQNQMYGNQFQSPFYGQGTGLPWQYNNGIPGLGYDIGGLGSQNFWDYGLYGNQGGLGFLNNSGYGNYNYDNYGLGLGFGDSWYTNPHDYGGGWGNVGYNNGLWLDVGWGGGNNWWMN